jgi:hypothetical protein
VYRGFNYQHVCALSGLWGRVRAADLAAMPDGMLAEHWAVRDDLGLMQLLDERKQPAVDRGRALALQ